MRESSVSASANYPVPAPHAEPAGAAATTLHEATPAATASGTQPYPTERRAREMDALAVSLASALDRVAAPLARASASFVRVKGWVAFGHGRLDDHARERFDRSGRTIRDLARLGESTWDAAVPGRQRRRDAVFIRDGWRCTAPGCTARHNLQEHHYAYRSRGGTFAPSITCVASMGIWPRAGAGRPSR